MPVDKGRAGCIVEFKSVSVRGDVSGNCRGSQGMGGISRLAGGCGHAWRDDGFGAEEQPKVSRAVAANTVSVSKVFRFRCI